MSARRRLKADTIRVETDANVVIHYNAYDKLGTLYQHLNGRDNQVILTEGALDALYEVLKQREAHKAFLVEKYGASA